MKIKTDLLGECSRDMAIAEIWLINDKKIPKRTRDFLIDYVGKKDYCPALFHIELFCGIAELFYEAKDKSIRLDTVSNYDELVQYYKEHASEEDLSIVKI